MSKSYDLTNDDQAAFALLEDAARAYDSYLEIAGISRVPVADLQDEWSGSVPAPAPLGLSMRISS